jgi:hypothetical protein
MRCAWIGTTQREEAERREEAEQGEDRAGGRGEEAALDRVSKIGVSTVAGIGRWEMGEDKAEIFSRDGPNCIRLKFPCTRQ